MVETAETPVAVRPGAGDVCLCEAFARATESAALAGARWLGRADEQAALEAASSGMSERLSQLPIDGRIVIGGDDERLASGTRVGAGGREVDLALDALEGSGVVARAAAARCRWSRSAGPARC